MLPRTLLQFPGPFKWRQFEPEVILLAVGWYLRFSLSYRDVEELLAERGLHADHVTVWRWVQRYAPEMERRCDRRLKPTNDSWRVDETYVALKASGCTCTGPWTPLGQRSTSFSRPNAMQQLPRASRAGEPSDAAGHQHRQACRLSTRDCGTSSRGCSGGQLPTPTGAVSW